MARIAIPSICKFCKTGGLKWTRVTNRHGRESARQVSILTGEVHQCPEYWKGRKRNEYAFNEPKQENTPEQPEKPFENPFEPKPTPKPEIVPEPIPEPVEPIPEPVIVPPSIPEWNGEHKDFQALLRRVRLHVNIWLVGPAGAGKTRGAEMVAEKLFGINEDGTAKRFFPQSVGPQTSKSDLIGYMDAHSRLVRTVLREAYEFGGLYLLDEVDAGNGGVLTILNAILANSVCAFPDGVIKKHADFYCIAAGNTIGQGANRQYSGRQKLDGASLNRFAIREWNYDERLERHLAGKQVRWAEYVHSVRHAAETLGVIQIFGTRQIQMGAKYLDDGLTPEEALTEILFAQCSVDDRAKLERHCGTFRG